MYRKLCVMALVALSAGLAHSFSWEIVISVHNRLEFIDITGTVTYTVNSTSDLSVKNVVYDPVHNRVLFVDNHNIYSFDIDTKKTERLLSDTNVVSMAYDPATELLFWVEHYRDLFSISLRPQLNSSKVSEKQSIYGPSDIHGIAVDSCGGFIYIYEQYEVKRARFNGCEVERVLTNDIDLTSLTIDQYSQKMYIADMKAFIKSVDLNGNNVRTILGDARFADPIIVFKDYIYYLYHDLHNDFYMSTIIKIPKNSCGDINQKTYFYQIPKYIPDMAANYNIEDITRENQNCDRLKSLVPSLLCVHGTQVSGESRCECAQGYSGDRCDVALCYNYCLHGNCSASAEGQPKCRCNPGYSGERCELSVCQGYCFRGDCNASAEGQPECRCNVGYSGERCQVDVCQGYCLNDGVCSLSEEIKPLCRCTGHFEGERCDVAVFRINSLQVLSVLKGILNTDITSDKVVTSSCASTAF